MVEGSSVGVEAMACSGAHDLACDGGGGVDGSGSTCRRDRSAYTVPWSKCLRAQV